MTGDLTSDGASDFAWATVCGLGTVAADRDVHVFSSDRRFLGTLPVEATVQAVYPGRTVHARDPRISGGRIRVEVWVWHTSDPTCCPSSAFDLSHEWNGSRFVAASTVPIWPSQEEAERIAQEFADALNRSDLVSASAYLSADADAPSLALLASRAPHQLVGCFTVSTGARGCNYASDAISMSVTFDEASPSIRFVSFSACRERPTTRRFRTRLPSSRTEDRVLADSGTAAPAAGRSGVVRSVPERTVRSLDPLP